MDERGVDEVSLNEINRASGLLNRSAIQYHFGSRDALVRELVSRTMATLDGERNVLLDHLELTGVEIDVRRAIEVVLSPMARQLQTLEGRRYLRLCGQMLNHPRYNADARELLQVNTSVARAAAYIGPAIEHLPPALRVERVSQGVGFMIRALADQARLVDADPAPREPLAPDLFATNIVDVMLGMLSAPTTTDVAQGRRRPITKSG